MLLVLGVAAIILPLAVKAKLVRFDVPVMIVLLLILAVDGLIPALDGLLLVGLWLARTPVTMVVGRRSTALARGANPTGHRASASN